MSVSTKTIEIEIALAVRKALESKVLDAGSAMSIVRKGMELLNMYPALKGTEKKAVLIRVLEQVSAGNDGVLGTDDDLLPEPTLKAIKSLLDGDLIGDIVDTFVALTKGGVGAVDSGKVMRIFARLKDLFSGLVLCVSPFKKKSATLTKQEKPLPAMIINPVAVPALANGAIDRLESTQVLYSSNVNR